MKFEESMSASSTRYVVMSKWLTPMMFFVLLNFMIVTIYVTSGFGKRKKQLHHTKQLSRSPSMLRRLRSLNFYQFGSFNKSHDGSTGEEDYEDEKNDDVRFQQWEDEEAGDNRSMNETYYRQRLEQESHINSSKLVTTMTKNSAGSRTAFRHFREAEAMENPKMADDEEVQSVHSEQNDYVYEAGQKHEHNDDVFDHEEDNDKPGMNEVFRALQRQGSSINRTKSDTEPASGAVPVKLVKKIKKSASTKSPFRHLREVEILEARRPATVKETKVKRAVKEEEDEDEEVDSKADDFINMFKQQLKLQRLDSNLRYKEMIDRGASR
ncbi:unnamed protein product [Rhodiola kirilowii]